MCIIMLGVLMTWSWYWYDNNITRALIVTTHWERWPWTCAIQLLCLSHHWNTQTTQVSFFHSVSWKTFHDHVQDKCHIWKPVSYCYTVNGSTVHGHKFLTFMWFKKISGVKYTMVQVPYCSLESTLNVVYHKLNVLI